MGRGMMVGWMCVITVVVVSVVSKLGVYSPAAIGDASIATAGWARSANLLTFVSMQLM